MREPMGDLSLNGMLLSELTDSIRGRVDKYYKSAIVHVVTHIRLSVSGAVHEAGYFYPRPDQPLSDIIMGTGGRDQQADLENVVIKRGSEILWSAGDVSAALNDGLTIERLNLESGDEVVVGFKRPSVWEAVFRYGSVVLTLGLSLYLAFSHR